MARFQDGTDATPGLPRPGDGRTIATDEGGLGELALWLARVSADAEDAASLQGARSAQSGIANSSGQVEAPTD
jgi:hypothetical protein